MSETPLRARHRAACRPRTPLDDAARAALRVAVAGRRYGLAVASSGLVMSVALPASAAVPAEQATDASQGAPGANARSVDVMRLTAAARTALATSAVVEVPADAAPWGFEAPVMTVTANPKPEPVVVRSSSTSRSQSRASASIPDSAVGNAVIEIAARYVGVPYVYGGTTPDGFDCSGFTSYVYAQVGIDLPRTSSDQRYAGVEVSASEAQPGDLIWSPGHIGIYAGDGMMIDAPRPGKTVQFRAIWQSSPRFIRVG